MNIRSLRNKLLELETIVAELKIIDIVIINEVWIYDYEIDKFNLPNYNVVYNCRNEDKGGGTAIFIKNNISFNEVCRDDKYNFTVIEILNSNPKIKVGTFYRAPKAKLTNSFIDFLESKIRDNANHIFFADVNLDLFKNNNALIKYKDMLATSNYYLVNKTQPTRITATTKTLVDHIITNFSDNLKISYSIEANSLSDHELTIASVKTNVEDKVSMKNKYSYKTNYDLLRNIVESKINNRSIESIDELIEILQFAKSSSTKKSMIRCRNNEWITPAIFEKMKLRKKAYDVYKKDPNNLTKKSKYLQIKKLVEKLIKETKSKFVCNNIEKAGNNSRKVWKVIKNTLNNKSVDDMQSNLIPCVINKEGVKTNSPAQTANAINDFFNNIGESIVQNIKKNSSARNPQSITFNNRTLFLSPVSEEEIYDIIMGLNKNATPGIDQITVRDLQELVYIIIGPITNLINKCLTDGVFPDILKKAFIIPLHKQGSKEECGNYRPISILSALSKVYEKVINRKIRSFIEKTIGFDKNQYGFLDKSGTESAITATLNQIHDALDEGYYVGGVFIDLTKAFDVVNHYKLLTRLDELGIRGVSNDLLKSYLHNRTQRVRIDGTYSEELVIKTGVPQGSLLGPLLYLLFIMNIPRQEITSNYNIYADDTNLIAKAKTMAELENTLNRDLKILSDWLDSIELCINIKKTNYMIFMVPNKKYENIKLKIKETVIERVGCIKYLGIFIDEFLKWDKQVKKIKKTVIPVVMAIKRAGGFPSNAAKMIYNGFILSKIRYNICSWSHCAKFHTEQIGKVMNKSLKTLYKMGPRTNTRHVYKSTANLDINQLIFFEKCKFIYNITNGNQKSNIILRSRREIHNYNTRSRNNINIPAARTSKKANSLKCSAAKIFNSLPIDIKNSVSINIFKRKLKNHLLGFRN
jgi:hypothetical protein